jgi:hypothetical protein
MRHGRSRTDRGDEPERNSKKLGVVKFELKLLLERVHKKGGGTLYSWKTELVAEPTLEALAERSDN